jgi:hypothetical protein
VSQEYVLSRKLSRIWQLPRTMARESARPRSTPLGVCHETHKDRRSHGRQDIIFSITFFSITFGDYALVRKNRSGKVHLRAQAAH